VTLVGVAVTVEVTGPAEAVAVIGRHGPVRYVKVSRLTKVLPFGGFVPMPVAANAVRPRACCANTKALGGWGAGAAGA
jgi:hypothetical protein